MSLLESEANAKHRNHDLIMHHGWEDRLVGQLLENSRQPHIDMMTDDPAGLFSSELRIEQWRKERFSRNNPMITWLGTAAGELAGVAWIENAHVRRNKGLKVFGVRVYEGHLGQGHGIELTKAIHERFDNQNPGAVSQFTMLKQNNAAFVLGVIAGYQLDERGRIDTQTYIRNRK